MHKFERPTKLVSYKVCTRCRYIVNEQICLKCHSSEYVTTQTVKVIDIDPRGVETGNPSVEKQ